MTSNETNGITTGAKVISIPVVHMDESGAIHFPKGFFEKLDKEKAEKEAATKEIKPFFYNNPLDMTVEEWREYQSMSREAHKVFHDSMTTKQWNKHAGQHNQRLVNEIVEDWNCTELEAWASMELDTDSLEATQKAIATAVTHDRLLISLFSSNLAYLRNEHYKGQDVSEEFLQSEAKEMTEEQAYQFTYDWEQLDEYEEMTEAEKEAAIFGSDTE